MDGCEGLNNYLMNEKQIEQYKKVLTKNGYKHLLSETKKEMKGGSMPKAFKFLWYLGWIVLSWRLVLNIDKIIAFFMQKGGI